MTKLIPQSYLNFGANYAMIRQPISNDGLVKLNGFVSQFLIH
jgi:hypothetical protein